MKVCDECKGERGHFTGAPCSTCNTQTFERYCFGFVCTVVIALVVLASLRIIAVRW